MSSPTDENFKDWKSVDVKLADVEATPELKVDGNDSDDAINAQLVVLAPSDSEQKVPTAPKSLPPLSAKEDAKDLAPAPMPRILFGVPTALCFWLFNLAGLVACAGTRFESFSTAIPYLLAGLVVLFLHLLWFGNALKQLKMRTAHFLPECSRTLADRWLLICLPAAWSGLFAVVLGQHLYAATAPALEILPWLL